MDITLRRAVPGDAQRGCAEICYHAFRTISQAHNFPPDIPSVDVAMHFMQGLFAHPRFYCVVAEQGKRIVGSNVLDERDTIYGIGPITVDPEIQNRSAGRRLMENVMARAAAQGAPGVRLVQAAFHNRSLSLYTSLGFDVREPLACVQGAVLGLSLPGRRTRPAAVADLEACNAICRQVHGHDRRGELGDAISRGLATVVEYEERITGYACPIGFFGHAVGESDADLKALIGAAKEFAGPGFLLPTRNGALFRWCLAQGLRVVQPMTLMSIGLYNEPAGAFLPSISY